ncbi:Cys-Gly metallodipeptidase [Hypoxylon texense]
MGGRAMATHRDAVTDSTTNELAHAHNAMLRGLNALYLQAPSVRLPADAADFLFLARAWSAWVLDHHVLKETAMLPGFEAALRLEPGSLRAAAAAAAAAWTTAAAGDATETSSLDSGKGREEGTAEDLALLLQNVHAYAESTLAQPASYSGSTLQALLAALAGTLVPHLHNQIPLLARMQDLSSPSASASASASASTSPYYPSPAISPPSSSSSSARSLSLAAAAADNEAAARRANKLTQTHLACEAALADKTDPFVVPPMVTRLRDATYDGGGGNGSSWPRLSVPALHAVADRLSPKHAGAWRFCPCDVWGKPRELGFLADGEGKGEGGGREVRQ